MPLNHCSLYLVCAYSQIQYNQKNNSKVRYCQLFISSLTPCVPDTRRKVRKQESTPGYLLNLNFALLKNTAKTETTKRPRENDTGNDTNLVNIIALILGNDLFLQADYKWWPRENPGKMLHTICREPRPQERTSLRGV